jgi:DNA primase
MDAIAVTLASRGLYLGVAPLGTSLTEEQAAQVARLALHPRCRNRRRLAGRIAAERDFWMLSSYRMDPLYALLPDGTDPADLLALSGPTALAEALATAQPHAERLLGERLENLPPAQALREAARVVAARPARHWGRGSRAISLRLGIPMPQVRHALLRFVKDWNTDPRRAAQQPLQAIGEVKHRISTAAESPAEQRRTPLAREARRTLPSNRARSTPIPTR